MFDRLVLETRDDYLNPLSKRMGRGVFFARFIGYDDDVMVFFRKVQDMAARTGSYIRNGLKNPPGDQVSAFTGLVNLNEFRPDLQYVTDAVNQFLYMLLPEQRACFSDAVLEMLNALAHSGANPNILKNAFAKYMCWARYSFERALRKTGEDEVPKVLYEGNISKYEAHMLRILSRAGCDILYIHFQSEISYLECDPDSVYSQPVYGKQLGVPKRHFSAINLEGIKKAQALRRQIESTREMVVTNSWMSAGFMEEVFKTGLERGPGVGICYNIYGRYLGFGEKELYLSDLYRFRMRLQDSGRIVILQDTPVSNPTLEEVSSVERIDYQRREELIGRLASKIQHDNETLTALLRAALVQILEQNEHETLPKLYNHGMKLICWLNRYIDRLFTSYYMEAPPVFLYYGPGSASEAEFLNLLSLTPVDVIQICPDKNAAVPVSTDRSRCIDILLENSSDEIFHFPLNEPRLRVATTAYNAQKELDRMLYSDTGLFRHKQFTRCNPVTLKTTYDEIEIYWHQEAKYRPNFETGGGRVVVPNIFARVCGVPDGMLTAYFQNIQRLLTPRTILIRKIPHITLQTPNSIRPQVHKFFRERQILPDEIKRSPQYRYDHLSDTLQDFILEKIQLMIEWELIQSDAPGVEYTILSTLLNLDRHQLRLIQEFEFTGEIPKVVVIHVEEATMSLEDCILLAFFNLAGFDIIVFTPTGYRNVEKYIRREAFEEYQVGPYCFDVQIPALQIPSAGNNNREGGLLNRLFGKG